MRFLYIAQLWEGSTSLERLRALERLGVQVAPFDTTPFLRQGVWAERSLAHRANFGRPLAALNRNIRTFGRVHQYDGVWVDKGVWLSPEVVAELRTRSRLRLAVHYTPDAQFLQHRSRHILRAMELYDLFVTTKPFELAIYREQGARDVILVLQGYGSLFHPRLPPPGDVQRFGSDVTFIGHCQRHYARRLKAVSGTGADLRIWGPKWSRYAMFHGWARPHAQSPGLWGTDYPNALATAKIALGLLSKFIPETTTTRSFEIPAMGTFFLAERTREHLSLFEEGREAEFFESDDELTDKVRFYLAQETPRQRIAAAGRARCVKSGYSIDHQLSVVLTHLVKKLGVAGKFRPAA